MPESISLRLLRPSFRRYEVRKDGRIYFVKVDTIGEAHGVEFLCPKCFRKNVGPVGTHLVVCWSRAAGTPEEATPGPGRWRLEGTSLEDLTLGTDEGCKSNSVKLTGGCEWHGHVKNGEVTF